MTSTRKKSAKHHGFWRFLISKVFWLNLLIAAGVLALVIWATLLFIRAYSRHGESETVPNLVGLPEQEAKSLLSAAGLEYAVMDSTFDPDQHPTSVLNQDPPPDAKVKSGRKIYVTVNMSTPPQTEVPEIEVGTSVISVREILESHGIKVADISYRPFQYKDVFLDMYLHGTLRSLKAGDSISKGSKVDLILGNGLGDTEIELPDFRGLTYIEAYNLIQLKDLSPGSVIPGGTISDTMNAFVFRQNPPFEDGKMVNLGTMVDLWISNDPAMADSSAEGQDP